MSVDLWSQPYEAPTSLDAGRVIGTRARRPTLWTLAGFSVVLPLVGLCLWLDLPLLAAPTVIWALACYVLATDWGHRPAEYWLRVWWRHRRLPRRLDGYALQQHHASVGPTPEYGAPRGAVEIEHTANLRLADTDTLGSTIRKLAAFLNGLRFPVQIVVRSWQGADGLIERHWYVAITAPTDRVLVDNLEAIVTGLSRAGLKGRALNGDLYDTLQRCWSITPPGGSLGPKVVDRERRFARVDGELVRGFLLTKMPRTVEPNWLAPILDGELPIDFSLWLDPTDNADEISYLSGRTSEWETAQILTVAASGFRDPDIDDAIKDATRTRLLIRRRELRVFRASMAFVVRAQTEAQLATIEDELVVQVREQVGDDALVPLDYEHDRAPLLVVPLGEPVVQWPLRTVTPALARGYPFSNSSLNMPRGVDCGTSIGSKRTNRLDLFGLPNPHVVVLGTSGAGKGFWVKVLIWRLIHGPNPFGVVVLQSEKDEYTALADALGPALAEVIRITSLEQLPDLVYTWSGALRAFRPLQLFDLTRMEARVRGQAIAFLLTAVEYTAQHVRAPQHGLVVIDELGIVLESDAAAQSIETAYRRFRSIPRLDNPREVNRRAMIGVSQRPSDLLRHPRGKVLADLALTHVYFRQRSTELGAVKQSLNLTPDEANFLDACDEGTGLLVADHSRVAFHLQATTAERAFAET